MPQLKIISYNLNGIRSAISKGLADWIKETQYDVYLFQEIKANELDVPKEIFNDLGYVYHTWFSAEKKGYSGTGIISKLPFDAIRNGIGIDKYDKEGRVISVDIGDLTIVNAYFPSGSSGEERQGVKMEFLDDFFAWINVVKTTKRHLVVSGDYNICHQAIDIHDPKGNKDSSGFLPEERAWMTKFFEAGFVDSFRHLNAEPHHYSWWSYRAGARGNNKGWRIDYNSVSAGLESKILDAKIFPDVKHSDHCPIYLEILF